MAASLRIISKGCGIGLKQNRTLYSKIKTLDLSYLNFRRNASVVRNIPPKSFEYCYSLVRQYDHENYLCTLLLRRDLRAAVIVLRAFNIEVAMVASNVSDPIRGLGRFQFWREALDGIYSPKGTVPQTPVAQLLNWVANEYQVSKSWLSRLIEARASNPTSQFKTLVEMDNYYEQVVSSMNYLLLELHGIKDVQADHAASHLGRCYGMVNLIKVTPSQLSQGNVMFPHDLLAKHSVSQEDIKRGKNPKGVSDVVYEIASVAKQHLDKARSLKGNVPNQAMPVFLPSVFCDNYLTNLQKVDFNVFDPTLNKKRFLYHKLLLQRFKKTY
ncbi:NADH dehydrogenase (ubiquinone) complex I, assembly factor 6-like [Saccostrea echinata]|uniref:NADH dehydrogenase (ubiquinone) complex I, assembly factor 6-like n=1 Tax=Saccostrea echinata TaxID=191078 RepID=UPI002A826816|nr:NADH dehydrogenase (ubiquinone) complex I, assembly factor 6-like [Saccostrea echinata]